MISASKHVLFGFNLFHVSSLTNYVNSSTVAQNVFCLFKIPLNDAFLKGTVEIKEVRLYCKPPLAIHFT